MNARNVTRTTRLLATALLLTITLGLGAHVQGAGFVPSDAVLGESFSVTAHSPSTSNGFHPADIVGANGQLFISCADLGLICNDPDSGATDDIGALSFGNDFNDPNLPPLQFAVSAGAKGVAGSAVSREAACTPSQVQADVFESSLDKTNLQDLDGDGQACGDNAGIALGLSEGKSSDSVDALAQDPCESVDFDCNGVPDGPVFLVLAKDSPSLSLFGATPADIIQTGSGALPEVWAAGIADLDLKSGDEIDALCLEENGDGIFDKGDNIILSLTPGSPTLAAMGAGPADLITTSPLHVIAKASTLGLAATDDVDALACGALVVAQIQGEKSFLPALEKNPQ